MNNCNRKMGQYSGRKTFTGELIPGGLQIRKGKQMI